MRDSRLIDLRKRDRAGPFEEVNESDQSGTYSLSIRLATNTARLWPQDYCIHECLFVAVGVYSIRFR